MIIHRIKTRCTTPAAFIKMFSRFVDGDAIFLPVQNGRLPDLHGEIEFSISLEDGAPQLAGSGIVAKRYQQGTAPAATPGVRVQVTHWSGASLFIHRRIMDHRRSLFPQSAVNDNPRATSQALEPVEPAASEARSGELPANPFVGLDDEALHLFVECSVYEHGGGVSVTDEIPSSLELPAVREKLVAPPPAPPPAAATPPAPPPRKAAPPAVHVPELPAHHSPAPVRAPLDEEERYARRVAVTPSLELRDRVLLAVFTSAGVAAAAFLLRHI